MTKFMEKHQNPKVTRFQYFINNDVFFRDTAPEFILFPHLL